MTTAFRNDDESERDKIEALLLAALREVRKRDNIPPQVNPDIWHHYDFDLLLRLASGQRQSDRSWQVVEPKNVDRLHTVFAASSSSDVYDKLRAGLSGAPVMQGSYAKVTPIRPGVTEEDEIEQPDESMQPVAPIEEATSVLGLFRKGMISEVWHVGVLGLFLAGGFGTVLCMVLATTTYMATKVPKEALNSSIGLTAVATVCLGVGSLGTKLVGILRRGKDQKDGAAHTPPPAEDSN